MLKAVVGVMALTLTPHPSPGYTVAPGDTLWGLAARNGVSVGSLAGMNGIADPDLIVAGQRIAIPRVGAAGTASAPAGTAPQAPTGLYQVRSADTLATVAPRLGVTPDALAAANGILDGRLFAGALLRVPGRGASTVPFTAYATRVHTVTKGETLKAVAARNQVSTSALAVANHLKPTAPLAVGSRLVVPVAWRCPVSGPVSFMNDWGFAREGGNPHQGTDLFAPRGRAVVAPVSGVVSPDPNHLGGNAFSLAGDDGNRYYGAHLDRYGATGRVAAGTIVGYVGDSGDAKGGPTHLHFEIHPGGGQAQNPYPTVQAACR